jgi:predicted dienelactone hydrolase
MQNHFRKLSPRTVFVTVAVVLTITGCQSNAQTSANNSPQRPRALTPIVATSTDAFTTQEFTWLDEQRQRNLPAILYLPKSDIKAPLVVFSHGLGGSRYGYSHFGKFWASQGIASVHVQHPGSDRAIWTSQGFSVISALKTAASTDNAVARALDVTFTLDSLQKDAAVASRIDFTRLGVGGHSFGANTALMSAGAQFDMDSKTVSFVDKRIKAALVLSPPALPSTLNPKFVYGKINIPTLHLTGTQDHTPIPGAVTTADMRRESYDAIGGAPKYLGIYDGGKHSMFNDRTRDEVSEQIKASARQTSLEFFRSVFEAPEQQIAMQMSLGNRNRDRLNKERLFSWENQTSP